MSDFHTSPIGSPVSNPLLMIPLETRNKVMARCWLEMGFALVITALVSIAGAASGFYLQLMASVAGMLIASLTIIVLLVMTSVILAGTSEGNGRLAKMKPSTARLCLYIYAALMGFSLTSVFYAYDIKTIGIAFGVSALYFFALAIYGFFCKKDLTSLGPIFLVMLLVLLISEIVIFIFFPNPKMLMIINAVGLVLFSVLTVMDVQKAQKMMMYASSRGEDTVAKTSINCALSLYLDFINIFLYILRIFGLSTASSNNN